MNKIILAGSLLSLSLILAGCGGGGGNGDDGGGGETPVPGTVPLTTKADLLREMGIVGAIGRFLSTVDGSGAQAKAASTVNCNLSGTYATEDGSKNFSFTLFDGQARTVQFFRSTSSACKNTLNDGSVATSDGFQEFGSDNGASTLYGYVLLGSGQTPLDLTVNKTAGSADGYVDSLLGVVQIAETSTTHEVRTVSVVDHYEQNGGSNRFLSLEPGDDTAPFKRLQTKSNGALKIDGPYVYLASSCAGGKAVVTTPVTLGFDPEEVYINSGQLRISSGNGIATVTFAANGSASFQTQGGASGSLTRSEIQQAFNAGSC